MAKIVLEAKTVDDEFIKEYLEKNINEEMASKINNGTKTLKGCWKYIEEQARKLAVNNCARVRDDVVCGWAVKYFEDDSIKEGACQKPIKEKNNDVVKTTKKETSGQISLFDFNGDANGTL